MKYQFATKASRVNGFRQRMETNPTLSLPGNRWRAGRFSGGALFYFFTNQKYPVSRDGALPKTKLTLNKNLEGEIHPIIPRSP